MVISILYSIINFVVCVCCIQTSADLQGLVEVSDGEGAHHPVGVDLQAQLPLGGHHLWNHRGDYAHTTRSDWVLN